MRDSGVEAAWNANRQPMACPAWCTRGVATDHDRLGPNEANSHEVVLARYAEGGGDYIELWADETFEDGLGKPHVWIDQADIYSPDELETFGRALQAAAQRWRQQGG